MISLIIPTRNNLKYVKFAYTSIRTYLDKSEVEVVLLDDASSDGTWEWMNSLLKIDSNVKIHRNNGPDRKGHTVLYDVGVELCTSDIFGIFHADMIATPNYIKNMIKHLKFDNDVVCATRIEPPLHPGGPEKLVMDFGMEPESFRMNDFLKFVSEQESINAGKITSGIFAPWMMSKKTFQSIGGHDKRVFAPMELEDSDLFNRFLLRGMNLVQSRDSIVYHLTCRGSRFKDGINIVNEIPLGNGNVWKKSQDSKEYTELRQIKFKEWWRKWHMDVLHTEDMLPIVYPRYDTGFVILNNNDTAIELLEPWCDTLYVQNTSGIEKMVSKIQSTSKFNIKNRILSDDGTDKRNDVLVTFDWSKFNQSHYDFIKQLPLILKDSGEPGDFEYDIFRFDIHELVNYSDRLIHADHPWYLNKLA